MEFDDVPFTLLPGLWLGNEQMPMHAGRARGQMTDCSRLSIDELRRFRDDCMRLIELMRTIIAGDRHDGDCAACDFRRASIKDQLAQIAEIDRCLDVKLASK